MENPAATRFPEVDSLPDGFVEITAEPEPVRPPKEDLNFSMQKSSPGEAEAALHIVEKTQKPRNFPVPLSDTEHFDAALELLDDNDRGSYEQLTPHLADTCSVVSVEFPGQHLVVELAQGTTRRSEKPADDNSIVQATNVKEIPSASSGQAPVKEISLPHDSSSESKKAEASETKCMNAKRSSKLENDVLELTLKYQQVLTERDGAIAVRDKLERLCRELQRQNKMLMDECKRVSAEGQTLRLELSAKFQDAIKEVSIKLENQKDECISLLKENEMQKIQLKQLSDQYLLSEQHHEQELKQKDLELQIAELKIKQNEEKMIQERSQMKLYADQVSELLATEKNLRSQLTSDGEKFQQFQDALVKSNEVFETFKQEIEKMAKTIKDLKNDNTFLKSKCDNSDFTLVKLVEERELTKKDMERLKNQKEKLESLCRTLQAERRQNSSVINGTNSPQS